VTNDLDPTGRFGISINLTKMGTTPSFSLNSITQTPYQYRPYYRVSFRVLDPCECSFFKSEFVFGMMQVMGAVAIQRYDEVRYVLEPPAKGGFEV
jgi:hypothetical protein